MKELVLIMWGAMMASGWWAIAEFGIPKGSSGEGLMTAVTVITLCLTVGFAIYFAFLAVEKWNE